MSPSRKSSRPTPGADDPVRYTIDQLAQVTGMTVRNIRAHQSRGLLPPPEVRGRTGFYGPEHVARIQLIVDMQADGFNLGAIARLLQSTAPGTATKALTFSHALREPWEDEQTEIMDAAELATRAGASRPDAELLRRSEELGLIAPLGDGRYEVLSPSLIRAGEALVSLGIPIEAGLEVQDRLNRHAEGIARAFVRMFVDTVWTPFEAQGKPDADWPRVQEALERLRPLAGEAVNATFRLAMGRAVETEAARMMAGPSKPSRRRHGR
ncbi:MAG TPA: MerR family transcriptional regulator [Candidatus Angelobacter sp.]|nr:MerR family transcriptional regulator [Candidatus Angelobacter sp.]